MGANRFITENVPKSNEENVGLISRTSSENSFPSFGRPNALHLWFASCEKRYFCVVRSIALIRLQTNVGSPKSTLTTDEKQAGDA